jgi:Seryl-tRNA synthetase
LLRIIKDRLEEYRESLKKRHSDFPLDHLLELDEKRRKLISEINNLRHEKNLIEEDVARKMKAGNKEIDRERLKELDKK